LEPGVATHLLGGDFRYFMVIHRAASFMIKFLHLLSSAWILKKKYNNVKLIRLSFYAVIPAGRFRWPRKQDR
ncbi:MAG: hypothetical protein ACNA7H_08490, partial [Desulfotignum sp.]